MRWRRRPRNVKLRVRNPDGTVGEMFTVTEGGTLTVNQPFEYEGATVYGEGTIVIVVEVVSIR